jgi:hypothetical protein
MAPDRGTEVVQPAVQATRAEQLVVGNALHDAAGVEHDDLAGVPHAASRCAMTSTVRPT